MSKLLDNVLNLMRARHYSYKAVKGYVYWIRQYIFFHNVRHPAKMGAAEVKRFLAYLAIERSVSASTQNQGLSLDCFFTRKFYKQGKSLRSTRINLDIRLLFK